MHQHRFNHSQIQDIRELVELPIQHAQALDKTLTDAISDTHTYRDQVADVQRQVAGLPESAIQLSAEADFDDTDLQVSLDALATVYRDILPHRSLGISFNSDFVAYLLESPTRTMAETFKSLDNAIRAVLVDILSLRRKLLLARKVRAHLHLSAHGVDPDQLYSAMLTAGVPGETAFSVLAKAS